MVVCEQKEEDDDDDDDEVDDELTGKEIPTLFSMAKTAMKNALEVSDTDLENWATWLQITKEENDRDVAHSSSSSSKSKFSIKIEDKSGAIIDTRDWKILRYILRKEMQQKSQKTYDLPNDSSHTGIVALVKNGRFTPPEKSWKIFRIARVGVDVPKGAFRSKPKSNAASYIQRWR